jgi:hypothetical protein
VKFFIVELEIGLPQCGRCFIRTNLETRTTYRRWENFLVKWAEYPFCDEKELLIWEMVKSWREVPPEEAALIPEFDF